MTPTDFRLLLLINANAVILSLHIKCKLDTTYSDRDSDFQLPENNCVEK